MKKTTLVIWISVLALFLRIYVAVIGPIEFDETVYVNAAAQYNLAMRQGDWSQIPKLTMNNEHPQFFKLVYAVGLMGGKTIPDAADMRGGKDLQSVLYWRHLIILRMISVFFGTATVFLIGLVNPLAGLFLAINTYAIKYTSVIYLEALPAFTSLAALMTALKSIKAYQNSSKNWRGWAGWLVLSSMLMGMTAASKYIYAVVGLVIIAAILIEGRKHKISSLLGLAGWGLLALAFFFLFDPILWHSPLNALAQSVNYHFNYSNGEGIKTADYPFWQPIQWLMISIPQQPNQPIAFFLHPGDYFISADTIIFILALVGLPTLFKKNISMFIWLVLGLAFLLVWNTKWPQYIVMVLAPFCVSAAYGFEYIYYKLKSRIIKPSN
jgi:hypothetical protein